MPKRNTEWIYIKGKSRWSQLFRPDIGSYGGTPKYKQTIYPDPDSLEIIRNLQKEGIKNEEKRDEDGSYFSFYRPVSILVEGKTVGIEPVEIVKADGSPFREALIGRGSDITLKLEVYNHRTTGKRDEKGNSPTAKAARLASVRVDNLIPATVKHDYTESQQRLVQGLPEQPKPNFNF